MVRHVNHGEDLRVGLIPGGSHIDMVYVYVPAFWGAISWNLVAIGGFSSEMKEPKLHKLGVFWANYEKKKAPNLSKIGCFSFESSILMGG